MTDPATEPPLSVDEAAAMCEEILAEMSETVIASETFLETVLTGVLVKKHVLIEDVPGTGKTLTAQTLADVLGIEFNRIQFTPDLLPSDISGSMVFDDNQSEFRFNRGPIFTNVLLADEINRAPPKTQAALLEAMEENQVSVGNQTRALPDPFFVIATQNPVEQEGTFELPESQLDRFIIKTEIGYPDRDNEQELIDRRLARMGSAPTADNVIEPDQLSDLQVMPEHVHVAPEIRDYILDIGRATRDAEATDVGVSPRGIERYVEAVRARAVIRGREYVVPDDVKALAAPVLAHRLVLRSSAVVEGTSKKQVISSILEQIDVPSMDAVVN